MKKKLKHLVLMDHKTINLEPYLNKYTKSTGEVISRPHLVYLLDDGWFLFAFEGDLDKGFMVLSVNVEALSLKNFIRIELAYSETDINSSQAVNDDLSILAQDVGASYIEFITQFLPVAEHGKKAGYSISKYIQRKAI